MLVKYCNNALRVMVRIRVSTRLNHLNRKILRFTLLQRTVLTAVCVTLTAQLGGCSSAHRAHHAAQVDHLSFDELVHEFPRLTLVANFLPEEISSRQDSDERIQQLALFAKVFGLARREYIKPLSPERLVAGALAGVQKAQNESLVSDVKSSNVRMTIVLQHMMSELDAHSKYLTPADYERVQVNKRGEFGALV